MIPVKYRYKMVKEWCRKHDYSLCFLSNKLFGTPNKIVQLSHFDDVGEGRCSKRNECWRKISEYTKLDFDDFLSCDELKHIVDYLIKHLEKYGNAVLSEKTYMQYQESDFVKLVKNEGYNVKVEKVEHVYNVSYIFSIIKK